MDRSPRPLHLVGNQFSLAIGMNTVNAHTRNSDDETALTIPGVAERMPTRSREDPADFVVRPIETPYPTPTVAAIEVSVGVDHAVFGAFNFVQPDGRSMRQAVVDGPNTVGCGDICQRAGTLKCRIDRDLFSEALAVLAPFKVKKCKHQKGNGQHDREVAVLQQHHDACLLQGDHDCHADDCPED